jgi:hypothetical protein
MRCFRSTREYVNWFCRDKGRYGPKSTWYWVEYDDGRYQRLSHAPRSYAHVNKAVFCVDEEGFVERIYGRWIECPGAVGRKWLLALELRRVFQEVVDTKGHYDVLHAPINVAAEVHARIKPYLTAAKNKFRQEYNTRVLKAAEEEMVKAGEFALLDAYGDSLDKPPQW